MADVHIFVMNNVSYGLVIATFKFLCLTIIFYILYRAIKQLYSILHRDLRAASRKESIKYKEIVQKRFQILKDEESALKKLKV